MTAHFDEDRHLCPDGSCIGVLGPDGHCKVCGRTGVVGDAPFRESVVDEEDADELDADAEVDDEPAEAFFADDEDRRLCPDGSCIGVLGDDGRCKVCGASP